MSKSTRTVHPLSVAGIARWIQAYSTELIKHLQIAYRRWQRDDVMSLAASVAFYLSLSIFPMLLLLTGGLGMVLKYSQLGSDAHQQLLAVAAEHCSPSLKAKIDDVLEQLGKQSLANGPIGFLSTLLAAVGVFYQFERAFDKIWRIPPANNASIWEAIKQTLKARMVACALLASVGAGIFAILLVNVAVDFLKRWFQGSYLSDIVLLSTSQTVMTIALNALAFALIFRGLPKRPVMWKAALRGGLLTSILWEIGRQLLASLLIGAKYTTAYGAIGSFIGLLLWFYWGVALLLFGAEYVLVVSRSYFKSRNLLRFASNDCVG